jgi:hypothetical protein
VPKVNNKLGSLAESTVEDINEERVNYQQLNCKLTLQTKQ